MSKGMSVVIQTQVSPTPKALFDPLSQNDSSPISSSFLIEKVDVHWKSYCKMEQMTQ